ncbi:hypothetical protein FN846DRAFT_905376 [Sphaerosporella brunnea]|uniref:Aminoglycoside phosphotransferase domain-containing protein n=1 Tax=Sphaerosporella brunnea TaxID=1250544 RepID=A0A5J5F1W4_9PEZI|nr:hypothetical protein FN846DRAFT_905376 [Sphaerosporella brunnea]
MDRDMMEPPLDVDTANIGLRLGKTLKPSHQELRQGDVIETPEEDRKDCEVHPAHPLVRGHADSVFWVKEYHPNSAHVNPTLVPLATADGEVEAPKRVLAAYERGLVFPHMAIQKPCDQHIPFEEVYRASDAEKQENRPEWHPWLVTENLRGWAYPEVWGSTAFLHKRESPADDGASHGIGPVGWSYRQRRRFVRKLAMLRLLFLFLRSRRLRGGGNRDPQLWLPVAEERDPKVHKENLHGQKGQFGPWENVEDMMRTIWTREAKLDHSQYSQNINKIANNIDTHTNGMRKRKDELETEMPYSLNHGDIRSGFNILMNGCNPTGVIDFEYSAYVPYSAAIADLSNQYPRTYIAGTIFQGQAPRIGYADWDEWLRQADKPFAVGRETWKAIHDHWSIMRKPGTAADVHGAESFQDYHENQLGTNPPYVGDQATGRTFNFRNKVELLNRWGEITWEDFVHGDRFDDGNDHDMLYVDYVAGEMPFDHWLFDVQHPVSRRKLTNDVELSNLFPIEGRDNGTWRYLMSHWYYAPVMFLVTRFVETYLNDDPLLKWEDPFFHTSYSGWTT